MKLVIVGGNGGTGAILAQQATSSGHHVTVLSRSGTKATHPNLHQIIGDAADPDIALQAVTGSDAVVITVGGSKGATNARTAVTRSIIHSMERARVRRLLVQSSLGAGDSASQLPGVIGFITKLLLATPLKDHNQQEELVRASDLDWTILRPTGLSRKPGTGKVQALQVGQPGTLGSSIPRADLADFMLQTLGSSTSGRKAFGLSGR